MHICVVRSVAGAVSLVGLPATSGLGVCPLGIDVGRSDSSARATAGASASNTTSGSCQRVIVGGIHGRAVAITLLVSRVAVPRSRSPSRSRTSRRIVMILVTNRSIADPPVERDALHRVLKHPAAAGEQMMSAWTIPPPSLQAWRGSATRSALPGATYAMLGWNQIVAEEELVERRVEDRRQRCHDPNSAWMHEVLGEEVAEASHRRPSSTRSDHRRTAHRVRRARSSCSWRSCASGPARLQLRAELILIV